MGNEGIGVHRLYDRWIAREIFVLEMQHVGMRSHVAQPLENGEGEVLRRHLEREALADEPGELRLMLDRIEAGDDPPALCPSRNTGRPGSRDFVCPLSRCWLPPAP